MPHSWASTRYRYHYTLWLYTSTSIASRKHNLELISIKTVHGSTVSWHYVNLPLSPYHHQVLLQTRFLFLQSVHIVLVPLNNNFDRFHFEYVFFLLSVYLVPVPLYNNFEKLLFNCHHQLSLQTRFAFHNKNTFFFSFSEHCLELVPNNFYNAVSPHCFMNPHYKIKRANFTTD